jgi:hypothetical protein
MDKKTRQAVPGYMKSPEAAKFLGLTESQFRTRRKIIPSIQLHERGLRLYRIEDLVDYRNKAEKIAGYLAEPEVLLSRFIKAIHNK